MKLGILAGIDRVYNVVLFDLFIHPLLGVPTAFEGTRSSPMGRPAAEY